MAKYERTVSGKFEDVVKCLENAVLSSGATMNLVDESSYSSEGTNVIVKVYDKYFMRNGNRASLSLTVVGQNDSIFISAIGAGGGSGIIFNYSLGVEDELVSIVRNAIELM